MSDLPNLPPTWPELSEVDAYKCDQAKGWLSSQLNLNLIGDRTLHRRGIVRALAAQYGDADFEQGLEETLQLVRDAFGERWMELNPS